MKKAAVLIILLILCFSTLQSFAEGITVDSGNGDKIAVLEDVNIRENTNGTVVVVFGDLNIDAEVKGNIIVVFGDLKINSRVNGQVVSILGATNLLGSAQVYGDLISMGSFQKKAGAMVTGQEVKIYGKSPEFAVSMILLSRALVVIAFALLVLISGLIWLAVSKKKYTGPGSQLEDNTGRKLLIGALGFIGASIIAVLLSITIIAPVLYIVLLVAGGITSSVYFGRMILKAFMPGANMFAEFVTGLLTVTLFKMLFIYLIPHEQLIFNIIVYLVFSLFINSLGIGIILDGRFRRGRVQKQVA